MNSASTMTRAIALTMAGVMIVVTLMVGRAEAGLITTEQVLATRNVSDERSRIASFIMHHRFPIAKGRTYARNRGDTVACEIRHMPGVRTASRNVAESGSIAVG